MSELCHCFRDKGDMYCEPLNETGLRESTLFTNWRT